jgi:uncharacterized membrane protein
VVRTVPVSSPDVAEAVKLTENIFRAVNIALGQYLKIVFDAMGINVWELIEAVKTKPLGYVPFYPGPGLGGHCIPIDPSISPGRPASTASLRASSSLPVRSTPQCCAMWSSASRVPSTSALQRA